MPSHSYRLSVLAFKEGENWVAQCLEYDIATQAKSLKALQYEIERVILGHVVIGLKEDWRPFEKLPPAPQKYWEMW